MRPRGFGKGAENTLAKQVQASLPVLWRRRAGAQAFPSRLKHPMVLETHFLLSCSILTLFLVRKIFIEFHDFVESSTLLFPWFFYTMMLFLYTLKEPL
ncbi:MAG: hypothetical protein LLF96_04555 [Eubacteriales bacterium]|nr:hypothetical protein [Eubacteriales bacterium]